MMFNEERLADRQWTDSPDQSGELVAWKNCIAPTQLTKPGVTNVES